MAIEWCQVCGSSVWSGQPCGKCAHDGIVAARDAEIARLKAEVARLTSDLVTQGECIDRLTVDLLTLKRALAAGPAALHYRSCDCCSIVERAQAEAMKEEP